MGKVCLHRKSVTDEASGGLVDVGKLSRRQGGVMAYGRMVTGEPVGWIRGQELVAAWGERLGTLPWEFFVTLTFDPKRVYPVGARRAEKEAVWWCGQVVHLQRRSIGWLCACERGRSGLWHVHGLLIGVKTLGRAPAAMWRARNGRCDVRPVTAGMGAVLYTTKDAARTGEVYFSDTLSQYCRQPRGGSVVALYPDEARRGVQPAGGQFSRGALPEGAAATG